MKKVSFLFIISCIIILNLSQKQCVAPTYRTSCQEIFNNGEGVESGIYTIDIDGPEGAVGPFKVYCDMKTEGGGWTRFNWLTQKYPAGQDPLGQNLWECDVNSTICRGRIPYNANPVELLVKDTTNNTYAAWKFNGSVISNAVLGALRDKKEYCGANKGAFQPYVSTETESYCGNGAEGGCDSFYYTSGSCVSVGNWGLHWDGDNAWCAAVFKMGATYAGGCGQGDQGFLNDCDCNDEFGELYYR